MKAIRNYFRKYPYVLILVGMAIIWMMINIIQGNTAQIELEKNGKYTLATIKEIKGAKSGRWVIIEFYYNGNRFTSEGKNETITRNRIGEKIFIKFLPYRPADFDFYDEVPIPDSLLNQPDKIWDSLPNN